jgi:hypothetical protein
MIRSGLALLFSATQSTFPGRRTGGSHVRDAGDRPLSDASAAAAAARHCDSGVASIASRSG